MRKKMISLLLVVCMLVTCVMPAQAAFNRTTVDYQESGGIAEAMLNNSTGTVKRDIILMLDISDSMMGTPLTVMKEAAVKFCYDIMANADDNRIALIIWDYSIENVIDFTNDIEQIADVISSITLGGGTKTDLALQTAKNRMDGSARTDAIKNIVLMTDGLPVYKDYDYPGPYTSDDYYRYDCANSAYDVAQSIMQQYNLYTLGFFHSLSGNDLVFGRRFLTDIQNAGFYEVINADELEFVFGDIAEDMMNGKKTGLFSFPSGDLEDEKDYTATYYYDDNYFVKNASEYNSSLATMSLCFALSAFGSNLEGITNYENKSRNAKALLDAIGFKSVEIETNDYFTVKPSEDSMGVVIGYKDIMVDGTPYTLIALATRGGGYEAEWAGNFTVGSSGLHKGFETAKNEAHRFLEEYISNHITDFQDNIKIWMAGYSRAAATVNMLAGQLNNDSCIAGLDLDTENIFAYCFEPPMGAQISDVLGPNYRNIHNIVNPNDLVTKVAPKAWYFARYGIDEPVIPSRLTSSNQADFDAMLKKFQALNNPNTEECLVQVNGKTKHILDTFQAKKIDVDVDINWGGHWEKRSGFLGLPSYVFVNDTTIDAHLISNDGKDMSAFLDDLIRSIAWGIGDRGNYTRKLQAAMRLVMAETLGGGYESYKWDKVPDILVDKLQDNLWSIAYELITGGLDGVAVLIEQYLMEAIKEAGIDLAAYGSVPKALAEALASLVRAIAESLGISGGDDLITLCYNYDKLIQAHYPELCLAWLQMQDINYTPNGHQLFVINAYRVIRINCPVDVAVYDEAGAIVAQFINDVPLNTGSTIVSSFTSDGEKVVYLPADQDYVIQFVATADGVLNYSVGEFSYETFNYTKLVNYNNVAISAGDRLEARVDKFLPVEAAHPEKASGRNYTLSTSKGHLISDVYLVGEDAADALFNVSVEADNADGGIVIGGGAYTRDSFAKVSAIPYDNCEFEGWYLDNTLISADASYRFSVQGDTHLVAKFTGYRLTPENSPDSFALITVDAGTGGSISKGATGYYTPGSIVKIEAVAYDGYVFDGWTSSDDVAFEDASSPNTTFVVESEATVTAKFKSTKTYDPGIGWPGFYPDPNYQVAVPATVNGSVTATHESAQPGTKVIIAVLPDAGYSVDTIKITQNNNDDVELTDNGDGTYAFTMPASNVKVLASFKKLETRFEMVDTTADGDLKNFRAANVFRNRMFSDVDPNAWYFANVKAAVDYSLMEGYADGRFGVGDSLRINETLAIADRLHNIYCGGSGKFDQTQDGTWYQVYEDYAVLYGIIGKGQYNLTAKATRSQFAAIISAALPDGALLSINDLKGLPDVDESDPNFTAILRLYNAGILTGVDKRGTFMADSTITREQIAAIITRIANPDLRKKLALEED